MKIICGVFYKNLGVFLDAQQDLENVNLLRFCTSDLDPSLQSSEHQWKINNILTFRFNFNYCHDLCNSSVKLNFTPGKKNQG